MAETNAKIEQQTHAQRRQVARDLIDVETILIRNGAKQLTVRLVDLSPKGFHARSGAARFERGEVVTLDLPLVGLMPGRVMWGLKGCFGAQFSVPIDARIYQVLLAQIGSDTSAAR